MFIIISLCYTKGPFDVCEYGTYGKDCRQTCGKCSGASHCDRFSGECPNGCMPGYYTALCNIGKMFA